MTAKEHYDNHLGSFYSWMAGEFQIKQNEQQQFFEANAVRPLKTGIALDLGSGHGLQSISLARLGFNVHAVDFNKQLLDELSARREDLSINTYEQDISTFLSQFTKQADVIVCMGDTLTHLEDLAAIELVVKQSFNKLAEGGKLIFSFRDLKTELKQDRRFIPVRSDEHRIHTCFLEYFPDCVHVYDILHEQRNGTWEQKVSWYPKLRISQQQVEFILAQNRFKILFSDILNRMIYLVAERN